MNTSNAKILKTSKAKDGDLLVISSNTITAEASAAMAEAINTGTTKLLQPVPLPSGIDLDELRDAQDGDVLVLFKKEATSEETQALSSTIRQKLGKRLTVISVDPADKVEIFTKRGGND